MSSQDFSTAAAALLTRALDGQRETDGAAGAFEALCGRVGSGLARWIGTDGWEALIARARADGGKGADRELRTLLAVGEILARLIGADLALRLLEQACEHPSDPPTGESRG
ncbi:MAG: hypothetical protein H0V89_05040 [Deltaproteobacteria bacterium]|nr:hypothetical protein [Deltaproteobacteria bacterium]